MSYPNINELSNAYTLCTCSDVCTHHCTVCYSPTWASGPCVKQLWLEHLSPVRAIQHSAQELVPKSSSLPRLPFPYEAVVHGQAVMPDGAMMGSVHPEGMPVDCSLGEAPGPDGVVCGFHCDAWSVSSQCPVHGSGPHDPDESPELQDRDIERIIDFMEEIGMRVEPWQAEAMRAIFRLPPNSVISVMHQRH